MTAYDKRLHAFRPDLADAKLKGEVSADRFVTDFEVGFDGLVLAAGISAGDVTTEVVGDDVLVRVDFLGEQTGGEVKA